MNRRNPIFLYTVLLLFILNTLSLFIYFRPAPESRRRTTQPLTPSSGQTIHHHPRHNRRYHLKPWPILPSYLPWSLNTNPNPNLDVFPRSCEAYFGNGYTQRVDLLLAGDPAGGWFRCFYSMTLNSSICEGGKVRMLPERIVMSKGGERLEEVIGRREKEELPRYESGAFQVLGLGFGRERELASGDVLDKYVPRGDVERHTMRDLMESVRVVGSEDFRCDRWIEEPTLLVTRYEYANLYHTFTDWYNAYVSSRVTGLPFRPRLVFLDGHCRSGLEETWRALFSGLRYAKNFSGSVCFRRAIFSPLGYETALFKGLSQQIYCQGAPAQDLWLNPDDLKTARLSEFGEMIRAAFGLNVNLHRPEKPVSVHNILFIRRENYLAHPRHKGKVQSRLSNEQEVFDSIQSWVSNHNDCKINLVNGLFAHMPMKDQVRAIQDASVIIGAHGAGLTHIVSATPRTVILEIISIEYTRPHFALIALWKGLEYHAINLPGSYANPSVVVAKLSGIMKSLGC